jgi:hypothetical protein
MKKSLFVCVLFTLAGLASAQTFTDLAGNATYEGKTGLKKLATAIDANFSLLESGTTIDGSFQDVTADGNVVAGTNITATAGNITATAGTLVTGVGLDAVGAVDLDYGSADVTDHTFVTDGTGDAEIVLPNDSIGDAEIAFDEVTGADLTLTDCAAITSSARVQGATLGVGATLTLQLTGTQLEAVVAGVTNVLDADVTTP